MPHQPLYPQWQRLMQELQAPEAPAAEAYEELRLLYTASGRHYHTLEHIQSLLHLLQHYARPEHDRQALELAAWYHDAVYEPLRHDNEVQSARLAEQRLQLLEVPQSIINRVSHLVRATATHTAPGTAPDPECHLFLDLDLAILGADAAAYARYAEQVRQEYAQVPDEIYKPARQHVLQKLLQKQPLYHTPALQQRFEQKARHNVEREIRELGEEQ